MRPAPEFDVEEQRLLDDVIARVERALRAVVEPMAATDRIVAVSMGTNDDVELPPSPIHVMSQRDWQDVLSSGDPGDRWERAWNPTGWSFEAYLSDVMDMRPDVDERAIDLVFEHDVVDPVRWLLQEVSRRLAHNPPAGASSVFVCFVLDPGVGEAVTEDLLYATPPGILAELDRLELLRPPP